MATNPIPQFLTQTLAVDTKDRGVADSTKSQVSLDSLIEPSAQISERTTIKKSVIGKHCKIGKMVKISGCIFLDHCVVDDGCSYSSISSSKASSPIYQS